jgi:hypothetical protein
MILSIEAYLLAVQGFIIEESVTPSPLVEVPCAFVMPIKLFPAGCLKVIPVLVNGSFGFLFGDDVIKDNETEPMVEFCDLFGIKVVKVEGHCVSVFVVRYLRIVENWFLLHFCQITYKFFD